MQQQYNLQQDGPSPRRSILLVVLLVISIVLATVYGREGADGPLHGVQSAFRGVSATVGGVSANVGTVTDAMGNAVDDSMASGETLTALREQNRELREMLSNAEEYRQEVERLQGLLDMKQVSGVTGPVAHIIGRSTSAWNQSITIDMGSEDGVESGMTIMGATGVIGQVSQVSAHSSSVRLLTDPNSGAAVMIQSNRADAIVRGSMTGLLYLEDLDEDVIPVVGDVIVTSGLGGSYERGLIVGAVVSVNRTANNPTGSIIVSPNDSASMLEEVIVVKTAPDAAAVEAATARAEEEARARAESEAQIQNGEGDNGNGGEYE